MILPRSESSLFRHPSSSEQLLSSPARMGQVVAEDLDIGKAIHKLDSGFVHYDDACDKGRPRSCSPSREYDRSGNKPNNIPISFIHGAKVACSCLQELTVCRVCGCLVEDGIQVWQNAGQVSEPLPVCIEGGERAGSPFQPILISVPLLFPSCYSAAWMTLIDRSENTAGVSTCCEDCCNLDDTFPTDAGCLQREALSSFVCLRLVISFCNNHPVLSFFQSPYSRLLIRDCLYSLGHATWVIASRPAHRRFLPSLERSPIPKLPNIGDARGISTATPKSGAITAAIAPSAWRVLSVSAVMLANLSCTTEHEDVERTSLGKDVQENTGVSRQTLRLECRPGGRRGCSIAVRDIQLLSPAAAGDTRGSLLPLIRVVRRQQQFILIKVHIPILIQFLLNDILTSVLNIS